LHKDLAKERIVVERERERERKREREREKEREKEREREREREREKERRETDTEGRERDRILSAKTKNEGDHMTTIVCCMRQNKRTILYKKLRNLESFIINASSDNNLPHKSSQSVRQELHGQNNSSPRQI
jgi:hypothetical protein